MSLREKILKNKMNEEAPRPRIGRRGAAKLPLPPNPCTGLSGVTPLVRAEGLGGAWRGGARQGTPEEPRKGPREAAFVAFSGTAFR